MKVVFVMINSDNKCTNTAEEKNEMARDHTCLFEGADVSVLAFFLFCHEKVECGDLLLAKIGLITQCFFAVIRKESLPLFCH